MSLSKPALLTCGQLPDAYARLSFFERLLVPWQELAEDAVSLCQAAKDGCGGSSSSSAGRCIAGGLREIGDGSEPEAADTTVAMLPCGASKLSEHDPLQPLWEAARGGLLRVRAPLVELAQEEEIQVAGALALLAATGPGSMIAVASVPMVALCGLTVKTKTLYFLYGLCMAGGAFSLHRRYGEESDRTLMDRSAQILEVSGMWHLLLAAGWSLPSAITSHIAHPDVVMRFLPDVICVPLLIWNLGYISGKRPQDMIPTTAFGVLGTAGYIMAAAFVGPRHLAMPFFGLGCACMLKVAHDLNRVLPVQAGMIATTNRLRTQVSSDFLVFSLLGFPLAQGLALGGCLSPDAELGAYVVLDVLNKLGVSHIVLRSNDCFKNAVRHFEERRRQQEALLSQQQLQHGVGGGSR